MNENQTLREQMWDLCYGLLSAEEVAALHKQIKSDPAAARLYAEVRLQADLVASAAKIEDESVSLSVPDEGRKVQPAAKSYSSAGESPFKPTRSGGSEKPRRANSFRAANWLAALAATLLVGLIGYGLYAPSGPGAATPDAIVATVYARQPLQSGLSSIIKVVAKDRLGQPASTDVTYSVVHEGTVLWREVVHTDQFGEVELNLPGSAVKSGAVLEVQARSEQQDFSQPYFQNGQRSPQDGVEPSPKFVVPLAAKPEPIISDIQFEQESYQPGETFRFWVHSRRAFSNQPAVEADDWKLVASDGREIQPAIIDARPEAGIVSGEIQLPADGPAGNYTLRVRKSGAWEDLEHVPVGVDAEQVGERARRFAGTYRNSRLLLWQSESLAEMSADKVAERQDKAKEKSELASAAPGGAGGAPPAPATVPPLSAPAESPARPASRSKLPAPAGIPLAAAPPSEQISPKHALSGNLPRGESLDEKGKLKNRQGDVQEIFLRAEEAKKSLAQSSGKKEDLVLEVPAQFAHLDLLAVVKKSEVQVATQEYRGRFLDDLAKKELKEVDAANAPASAPVAESAKFAESTNETGVTNQTVRNGRLSVPLPPEADGELGVTLYDQTAVPPKAVYQQMVRRASARDLNIDIKPDAYSFAPQQEMRLKLTVTDQNGAAVPHSFLSARIVKADALSDAPVAEESASPPVRATADKAEGVPRGGGPVAVPGAAGFGGGGGFGGKGGGSRKSEAKGEKKDAQLSKEGLNRDGKEAESTPKKAQDTTAKPGEYAADPAPARPALAAPEESGEFEKRSNSGTVRDLEKQLAGAENRAVSDRFSPATTYEENSISALSVVPQEVLLGSNDSLIQDAVRAEEVAAQAAHADFQSMVGRLVLVVAAGALLLLGLFAVLHRPAQAKVWVPAMVVVAASFGIGCFWLMNGKLAKREVTINVPEQVVPENRYTAEIRPMAPAAKPLPMVDDSRSNDEMTKEGESPNGIAPTPPPASAQSETRDSDKSAEPGPSRGGSGPASGKPGSAPAVEPKPASAASKPGEPLTREPRAEEDQKKEDRQKGLDSDKRLIAKDAIESKQNALAKGQKPLAMKSAVAESQREKKSKATNFLWAPSLPANEQGEVELNVQLPAEAGDYYLLVDVQGPGGVGTVQTLIPVRNITPAGPAPAAPAAPTKP